MLRKNGTVTEDNFLSIFEAKAKKNDNNFIANWMARHDELNSNLVTLRDETVPNVKEQTLADVAANYVKTINLGSAAADAGLALKSELPDTSKFALKTELPDTSKFALKTELPDTSNFALKADIPTNYLTAGNAYDALSARWGASQIEGLIKKSTVFNSLPAAVKDNTTNITNETAARASAISGLSGAITNLGSNVNTLGEQVETNATNIAANLDALSTTNNTVNNLRNGLSSTMTRVNAFTSCNGTQQCYSNDLTLSGTITLPNVSLEPGGDFTWTPINP